MVASLLGSPAIYLHFESIKLLPLGHLLLEFFQTLFTLCIREKRTTQRSSLAYIAQFPKLALLSIL